MVAARGPQPRTGQDEGGHDDPSGGVPEDLGDRLGYLLKHVQLAFGEVSARALVRLGITGRELAVLIVLGTGEPTSQQGAAGRLGVDRTTMVDLIDGLESKRLVSRRPDPDDRRRNLVLLTAAGRQVLDAGRSASAAAEREFLAPLDRQEADSFRGMLRRLLTPPPA